MIHKNNILFTATHSIIFTYFGSTTMVLKFPLTRAASTKGLQRYKGFCEAEIGDGDFGRGVSTRGNVADDGGDRFGLWTRVIDRLMKT